MTSWIIPFSSGQSCCSFSHQGLNQGVGSSVFKRRSHFSLSLCFEDVNLQDNEELKFILKIVNLVFAVLFTIEMFLKWIAFGLNKYFASVWTCLDFVIVLV